MNSSPETRPPRALQLSWDAILFSLLWAAQFWYDEVTRLVGGSRENNLSLIATVSQSLDFDDFRPWLVILLALYLGADLMLSGRVQHIFKLFLLWMAISAFVLVPTLIAIQRRHLVDQAVYVHDGAVQIEEAVKFLLAGKNPYVEDYTHTILAAWPFHYRGLDVNPALYHFIYLPFMFLFSVPFFLISQATLGWYDQRFEYLLLLVLSLAMLLRAARGPREQLAAAMVLLLNPLFVPFFVEGRNDIVTSFFLIGAILLMQRRQVAWAGVPIALAAATKQTTWFLIPFFIVYALGFRRGESGWKERLSERVEKLMPAAVTFAAILIPFLIWNGSAFIDDVYRYQAGNASGGTNYPINSVGLGGLVLGYNGFGSNPETFPFSLIQIAIGGPALAVLLYLQWRGNSLRQMLTNYAILFFIFGFFSRVFNDNHLGFALTWIVLPSFLYDPDLDDKTSGLFTASEALP